ncbi:MAG: hypothetical protein Kow0063_09850 [Anaerolineae bacterium]
MLVNRIDDLSQFDQLRQNWESVYAADPHAHFFVSWTWLRGWFDITPFSWFVLAVQPDKESPYVAFFPLNMRVLKMGRFNLIRELRMGGKPLGGYTGLVCLPEHEEEAIAALADYLQGSDWDSFQIEHMLDPRLDCFLKSLPADGFDVRVTNHFASSYIPLPDTWDAYLHDFLGPRTRRNLRRSLRETDSRSEFYATLAQDHSVERDIEVLLALWQQRWGPNPKAYWLRSVFRYLYENGCLWLGVLWDRQTPMAALAALLDQQKKDFYGFIMSRNIDYVKQSPAKVMFGKSVQYAIEHGFHTYDLIMGGDDYKFTLGARRRDDALTVVAARKNLRSTLANMSLNLARRLRDLPNQKQH